MAKRRREKMSEGKKNIIAGLIQEYDIKTAEDIQEALKDLLGGTIQEMMEAELDEELVPEVERLLDIKMNSPESEYGPKVQVINDYIEESLEKVKALAAAAPEARSEWGLLDEYFLRLVEK